MTSVVPSLNEIMNEQLQNEIATQSSYDEDFKLALRLQQQFDEEEILARQNGHNQVPASPIPIPEVPASNTEDDIDPDFAMALMLQEQEEKEYAEYVYKHRQPESEKSIITTNLKDPIIHRPPPKMEDKEFDDEEEYREYESINDDHNEIFANLSLPKKKSRTGIITKHNEIINKTMNSLDIDEFHDKCGDMSGLLISTKARNKLMKIQQKKQVKGIDSHKRVEKSEYSTFNSVIDNESSEILFKWENQGLLNNIYGVIGNGKESVVIPADGYIEDTEIETYYAIKIFKTTLTEFRNRKDYVKSDIRYSDINLNKLNSKKMIDLWCEKEFRNLNRLYANGINCPKPIKFKRNCLLMEFIGDKENGIPANQLKNIKLSLKRWNKCYNECKDILHIMYKKCHLIHGDFSEYNILYYDGKCYAIDVGQSIDLSHEDRDLYLSRDVDSIINFFSSKGVETESNKELISFIKSDIEESDDNSNKEVE